MTRQLNELARARWHLVGVGAFVVVSLVVTLMVAGTLSRSQEGDVLEVTGVFGDATGLRAGDDVRMAGVRIGRVTGTELGTGENAGKAVVTLGVRADQELHEDIHLEIDYLNLMGQRYVAVSRPAATEEAGPLADGAVVPIERTRPALDLTAMFNAFRPVFDLLQPADINLLATNIVQVLQGQGQTLQHLMQQTAELTTGLTDRDELFAEVVDNLTLVLASTRDHRDEIAQLLQGVGRLSEGLAKDRDRLATSLDALTSLSTTAADLVDGVAPHVRNDVPLAQDFAAFLASRRDSLGDAAAAVPQQLAVYLRTLGYGSFLNVYVCTLFMEVDGVPFTLDVGGQAEHSPRCRQ